MTLSKEARGLLDEVAETIALPGLGSFPEVMKFRLSHESQRHIVDELRSDGLLTAIPSSEGERYMPTVEGLLASGSDLARREVAALNELLAVLKPAYLEQPTRGWTPEDIAKRSQQTSVVVGKRLRILLAFEVPTRRGQELIATSVGCDDTTGTVSTFQLREAVLDVELIEWPQEEVSTTPAGGRIQSLEIAGYRPFRDLRVVPGDLTVIIGANATGKSSLFDFLRLIAFAASNPLPPEIDPRSAGRALFHVGGPERIACALAIDLGQKQPLRYEVEIQGPIGSPRVVRERLATAEPLGPEHKQPFLFLDFQGGKGVVRDQVERKLKRPAWTVQPNELALRRALDPTLVTLSSFQAFVASWRFYSGFDLAVETVRRPVPTEPGPVLAEDGSNLSAVLHALVTEHEEAWTELETHLRSAIPGFQTLRVKSHGGPGTVIATWREAGVSTDLTLADLSDGTIRFLCWATLCLAPSIPPLVCIDEPELGLHPRVLPFLAGLLRLAASRSQVIVATHSPYLLSQFSLDQVAVMRKEDGRAVFLRPGDSKALRREVDELGGAALGQLHVSDELEARS